MLGNAQLGHGCIDPLGLTLRIAVHSCVLVGERAVVTAQLVLVEVGTVGDDGSGGLDGGLDSDLDSGLRVGLRRDQQSN